MFLEPKQRLYCASDNLFCEGMANADHVGLLPVERLERDWDDLLIEGEGMLVHRYMHTHAVSLCIGQNACKGAH